MQIRWSRRGLHSKRDLRSGISSTMFAAWSSAQVFTRAPRTWQGPQCLLVSPRSIGILSLCLNLTLLGPYTRDIMLRISVLLGMGLQSSKTTLSGRYTAREAGHRYRFQLQIA